MIALGDGRAENRGKTNRYDVCDWIQLRPEHGGRYEEWRLSQKCSMSGCNNVRSGTTKNGGMPVVRMQHLEVPRSVEEEVGEAEDEEGAKRSALCQERQYENRGISPGEEWRN